MKSLKTKPVFHTYLNANQNTIDDISIKLTQTRALLLIGSDIDFSSYHPSVQQDYFGATLEYVEDLGCMVEQLNEMQ